MASITPRSAITVAAAGGHHLMLTCLPGIGAALAQRISDLLPDLTHAHAIEVSSLHGSSELITRPPLVVPKFSDDIVSVIGGAGQPMTPGAFSLADHGILLLEQAPEFPPNVFSALRQPLDTGKIALTKAVAVVELPTRFQLMLTASECPCSPGERCSCSPLMRRRYRDRMPAFIRDRIGIHIAVDHLPVQSAMEARAIAEVVAIARGRQRIRYEGTRWILNSEIPGHELRRSWPIAADVQDMIDMRVRAQRLSRRGAEQILQMAWTIADIDGVSIPGVDQMEIALALRSRI